MIYDKRAAANLIGCLMRSPDFLVNTDKYILSKDDFVTSLHRIVFATIYNLFHQGAEKITINDIHSYLQKYPELYTTFNNNKGSDFVLAAEEQAETQNFDIYYDRIKKLSLLRSLKAKGFDIGEWYAEDVYDINERQVLEKKLEESTHQEIITSFQGVLVQIESEFINKKNFHYSLANEGIEDLIESLKKVPELGLPLQGKYLTTVSRGARKGKFFLMSGATGVGKSRLAVGNAAYLAYPIRWCHNKGAWINEGSNQKVLFVTVELSTDEIQTLILSNISGVNEENILNGNYGEKQAKRIQQGINIMDEYAHNFHLYHMPDPNIEQLNSNIRRLVIGKQIENVFFDYIHTSPSLLAEFAGVRIREDVVLSLVSTALKNLANELNVFVWSGTQVNAHAMKADFIDESGIRGARAIVDKTDFACAIKDVDEESLKSISTMLNAGYPRPNIHIDVFKNRRGKYRRVRIWCKADLGISRVEDLFMTDEYGNEVPLDLLYVIDENAKCDIEEVVNRKKEEVSKSKELKITL